jgi:hypothetical protein
LCIRGKKNNKPKQSLFMLKNISHAKLLRKGIKYQACPNRMLSRAGIKNQDKKNNRHQTKS